MGGKVILVGAGPGNAGLMTLRGKHALETADVVLYDRLVGDDILAMIPESALGIDVGKSSGRHPIPQDKINALLLDHAKEGKTVVRLKGGDPYLFGRGAEELEVAIKDGIPFEVVPGVTSAISVPAYAGIPVSHRDYSSSVHIITAHKKNGEAPDFDYRSLVSFGGTLVFLMGLGTIDAITSGLLDAGMPEATPAALLENGTRPNQRKLVSSLAGIAGLCKSEEFISPSILVVGGVCALSDELDWFSQLPLKGVSVIVTRPGKRSALSQKLRELGADVVDFPCIRTEPLALPESFTEKMSMFHWLAFTSPYGAELFFEVLKEKGIDIRMLHRAKIAAVGEKTASVFSERGIRVDYVPDSYNANELGAGLPYSDGEGVLLFRAQDGTPSLATTLQERGFVVEDFAAYRTIRESAGSGLESAALVRAGEILERGDLDFVTFTSASTVQGFVAATADFSFDRNGYRSICIGEETAAEARKHGFDVVVSKKATIESIVEKIKESIK